MFAKIQQAKQQMAQMRELRRKIASTESQGVAAGGLVRVRMTGNRFVRRVTIDPDTIRSGDAELIEELVKAAMNDAVHKLEQKVAKHLTSLADSRPSLAGGP